MINNSSDELSDQETPKLKQRPKPAPKKKNVLGLPEDSDDEDETVLFWVSFNKLSANWQYALSKGCLFETAKQKLMDI